MWLFFRTEDDVSSGSFQEIWSQRRGSSMRGEQVADVFAGECPEVHPRERGWLFNLKQTRLTEEETLEAQLTEVTEYFSQSVYKPGYSSEEVADVSTQLGIEILNPWRDVMTAKTVLLEGWSLQGEQTILQIFGPPDIVDVNSAKDQSMGYSDTHESGILAVASDGIGRVYCLDIAANQQTISLRSPSDAFAPIGQSRPVNQFLKDFLPWW
ncbi:hypothetical protein DE4585_02976 [Mycobacteroides salmoniphilum]|uniref:Uncharacterized protein n=1 Tax=Mycobacteroides salmoniphilum TaxID=404941 RepID=A0A4R8RXE2_9MYCO|nr:hypothetical protein [Mycobacteroides salmoniphilum]TDZ79241.1 hypothetical protein DE4585_02976 [Mycobacteroides salmoniphilum]